MSDLIIPDAPEPSVGPEPVAAAVEAPEPVVEAPAAEAAPDPDMFPRSYVEELRQEAAQHRTRAKKYEEAFQGYDDDTRDAFLQFAQLQYAASQGDQEAIAALEEFYADDDEEAVEESDEADRPLTRAEAEEMARELAREEYTRLTQEREQFQAQQQMVANVRSTAEAMGYEFGTPEYKMLLTFANEDDVISLDDPLAEADKRMKAWQQSFISAHTGQKAEQADNTVAAPVGGGSAPDLSTQAWQAGQTEAQQHAAVRRSIAERFAAQKQG